MTETEIIKGCIKGDLNSQKNLYELFYGKMVGICLRYSKNKEEAKSIINEGFLAVFENIKNFRGDIPLEQWIKKIIIDTCIDYLKKNKSTYWIVNTVNASQKNSGKDLLMDDEAILNNLKKEDILKATQNLSPAYRVIFNLFFIDKYSHKQISERLDISEETSKSDLEKAKYNLRKNLTQVLNG
jgi:RNA polymerase sigma-70 factor (ECF subfamily)